MRHKPPWPRLLLVAIFLAVVATLVFIRTVRYENLISTTDEADYTQFAYSFSQGRATTSLEAADREQSVFAYHAFVTMPVLVFPYYLIPHPLTLTLWQILFASFAVFPLFAMARKLDETGWVALGISTTYLLNVNFLVNSLWFHETTLATALLIWAFYCRDRQWMKGFYTCLIFIALTKESLAALVCGIGLSLILEKEYARGTWIALASLLWFSLALLLWIPHFSQGARSPLEPLAFDGSIESLQLFFHPVGWLSLIKFLLPFLFLPLASPRFLVAALPIIGLLFAGGAMHYFPEFTSRHATPLVALFSLGTLASIGKIRTAKTRRQVGVMLFAFALMQHFVFSEGLEFSMYRTILRTEMSVYRQGIPPETLAFRREFLPQLAGKEPLSVSHFLTLYFAENRFVKVFPSAWKEANYLIIDLRFPKAYPFHTSERFKAMLEEIRDSRLFETEFLNPFFLVLKRRDLTPDNPGESSANSR